MAKTRKKSELKPNGKGLKGYYIGGAIEDNSTIAGTPERKYKNDLKSNLHDFAAFNADNVLSTVGAGNVIKSKDYQTKVGAETGNQINYGVQKIGPGIAGAIMDFAVPGLGTAVKTVVKGVEGVSGTDTGLNPKQSATQDKVGNMIDDVGSLASGFGKKKSTPSTTTTPENPNVPTSTVDTPGAQQTQALLDQNVGQASNSQNQTDLLFQNNSGMTEEEKQAYLTSQGLAKGGTISAEKAKTILHEGKIGGKNITDKQRKYFGAMSNKKADGGIIDGENKIVKAENGGFVFPAENTKAGIGIMKMMGGIIEKGKIPTGSNNADIMINDGGQENPKELVISKDAHNKMRSLIPNFDKKFAPEADEKATGKVKGGGIKAMLDGSNDLEKRKWMNQNYDPTTGETEAQALERYKNYRPMPDPNATENERALEQAKYQSSTMGTPTGTTPPVTTNTETPVVVQPAKKNWFDPQGTNVEKAFGLTQAIWGAQQLIKQGKRPVDTIPSDYLAAIEKAKTESQFGLSPAEEAKANRDIELQRRGEIARASQSGLDAQSQLMYAKSAGITADEANLNKTVASEQLRKQKTMYYNTLLGDKANMSKELFKEKLDTFDKGQMAGAGLMKTGLDNTWGARRYDREVARNNRAVATGNPIVEDFTKSDIKALAGSSATEADAIALAKKKGLDYTKLKD